ncbi:hypothetical protein BDN72DRAFT_879383 [Pluteus cervinus]|uniref:Uncharacterized protein n=1 Tax=Pluteus cervinus TaxID=181527 RepID=A0ACD3APJ2_9AGAR|nr:hypothetical protein BDN72DRAFT_879383 [Pluteus cervinus]
MISKSIALLLATYVSMASGATVYFCKDVNWGGDCHNSPTITGSDVCHNMEGGVADYNDQISSFGPGEGLWCTVFKDYGCTYYDDNGWVSFGYPGVADLRTISGFNDAISSYACHAGSGPPE